MAQVTLTIPDLMRDKLQQLADQEERSLNGQIRFILSKTVSVADTEKDEDAESEVRS